MSDQQYRYFLDIIKQIEFPTSDLITEEGRALYDGACDVMLMYRGHPDTLMQALRLFVASNVRPYAYAGVAMVVSAASYVSDGKYDAEGVKEALAWLEKAQELAPLRFEINVIEPGIYGNLRQTAKMRTLLDTIRGHPDALTSYRFALGEMWYWDKMNDLAQTKSWNEIAFKRAQTNIQRLYALNSLAGTYLMKRMNPEALGLYQEVVKIDPNDPWAWHNMSIIYMGMGDDVRAGECNERALSIMDFGAARGVLENLLKRWSKGRHPDILDDIPPYILENNATTNRPNDNPFFKRLFGG